MISPFPLYKFKNHHGDEFACKIFSLVFSTAKLVEVGYGIKKLTIMCVVEDDKVSIEDLSEKITGENEDLVSWLLPCA